MILVTNGLQIQTATEDADNDDVMMTVLRWQVSACLKL